mgnify:CR=1 FL=1
MRVQRGDNFRQRRAAARGDHELGRLVADDAAVRARVEDLARQLLAETGIATAPGTDFDTAVGNRFVRLSFAGATADMEAALDRLETWL